VIASGLALASQAPAHVRLVSGPGRSGYERGNLLFRSSEPGGDALLKVYRRRKSAWNDFWADFWEVGFERKRGASARRRCETEAASLALWREAGFDVPRLLARERPRWIGAHPFLAMEFIQGRTLHECLLDPELPLEDRQAWVARLARESARRHRCALDRDEPLLVHEHAMSRHVLVARDRLVTFDFEHGYRSGYPVALALTHEIASAVRSLWIDDRFAEPFVRVFVDAYSEPEILAQSCRRFGSGALRWRGYRAFERRHRGSRSKSEAMARLAAMIGVRG
jgi:tRNA A-37 threonylcarbamoyl transferase component Bud32